MIEVDLDTLTKHGLDKKEFVALYKMPLLIERVLKYNSLFNQPNEMSSWKPWVKNCFMGRNFGFVWHETKYLFVKNV